MNFRRRLAGPLLLLVVTACGRSLRDASTDSLLARDLTLAGSASPATPPLSLSDTAVHSASDRSAGSRSVALGNQPRATEPAARSSSRSRPARAVAAVPRSDNAAEAPAPPLPAPATQTSGRSIDSTVGEGPGSGAPGKRFGRGTTLIGHTNASICSLANRPGDRIVATLAADVVAPDGATLRAGTPILVELANPTATGEFTFRVKAVQVNGELIPIDGQVLVDGAATQRQVSKGGDKGKVIGGAIAGAILGRVLGGGTKGTVIGAAGGAAAGTIAASRNTVTETCLPAGATLTVTLSAPLVLTPGIP